MLEFYSGATGPSGRFNEGFSLRRLHAISFSIGTLDEAMDDYELEPFCFSHNPRISSYASSSPFTKNAKSSPDGPTIQHA